MFRTNARGLLRLAAVTSAAFSIASFAVPAAASASSSYGQIVAGTTASELSLALGTPLSAFTNFYPGNSASTASGTLIATDTSAAPALTVEDTATAHPGHMVAAGAGCTGSEAFLGNPLQVTVSGTGWTSASGSPITVPASTSPASVATASSPQAASTLTTAYTENIGASEVMLTGCVYSLTATYTLS